MARAMLESAAANGDAGSQFKLGQQLEGTQPLMALSWYERAAEQGLNEAQFATALLYDFGGHNKEVPIHPKKALEWYIRAGNGPHLVHADAWYNAGLLLDFGSEGADPHTSVEPDRKEASACFARAFAIYQEQSNENANEKPCASLAARAIAARFAIAVCHAKGRGVQRSNAEAIAGHTYVIAACREAVIKGHCSPQMDELMDQFALQSQLALARLRAETL